MFALKRMQLVSGCNLVRQIPIVSRRVTWSSAVRSFARFSSASSQESQTMPGVDGTAVMLGGNRRAQWSIEDDDPAKSVAAMFGEGKLGTKTAQSAKPVSAGVNLGDLNRAMGAKTAQVAQSSSENDSVLVPLDELPLSKDVLERLSTKFGISALYPVQAQAFDPVFQGTDLMAQSRTGTGKTLAFCLPLVEKILKKSRRPRPGTASVLILEPTRELAKQVEVELRKISDRLNFTTVYGGAPYAPQESALRRGVDILVATPGRLIDHLNRGNVDLSGDTQTVVLDEADEMLRMGFVDDVERILESTPKSRQMLLFSATMPSWVRKLSHTYLKDAVTIDVVGNSQMKTPDTITHKAIASPNSAEERGKLIDEIIRSHESSRTIVFAETKNDVDSMASQLSDARPLHGDIPQSRREHTMGEFRQGKFKVLVATDVAARGIDIPDVELVVQSFFPRDHEVYVHRSGRTGRAGKSGISVILYHPSNRGQLTSLARKIGGKIEPLYPPSQQQFARRSLNKIVHRISSYNSKHGDHHAPWFKEIAAQLSDSLGTDEALVAALALLSQSDSIAQTRSLLTSRPGYSTLVLERPGFLAYRTVTTLLDQLFRKHTGTHPSPSSYSRVEVFPGGALVDIESSLCEGLFDSEEDVTKLQGTSIRLATTLPASLFDQRSFGDDRGHARGRGGGGGGNRMNGHRGGRYQRDDRQGGNYRGNNRSFDRGNNRSFDRGNNRRYRDTDTYDSAKDFGSNPWDARHPSQGSRDPW